MPRDLCSALRAKYRKQIIRVVKHVFQIAFVEAESVVVKKNGFENSNVLSVVNAGTSVLFVVT